MKGFEDGISLEGCSVESVKDLGRKGRRYVITRSDGKMLPNLNKHLELFSIGMDEDWIEAFKKIDIYNDVSASNSNISVISKVKLVVLIINL